MMLLSYRKKRSYTKKLKVRRIDLVRFKDGTEMIKMEFWGNRIAWIKPSMIEKIVGQRKTEEENIADRIEKLLRELIEENKKLRQAIEDFVNLVIKETRAVTEGR